MAKQFQHDGENTDVCLELINVEIRDTHIPIWCVYPFSYNFPFKNRDHNLWKKYVKKRIIKRKTVDVLMKLFLLLRNWIMEERKKK